MRPHGPITSRRSFLACILSTQLAPAFLRAAEKQPDLPTNKINDLIYRSASDLARLIRSKNISSEELVRAYLARIAEVNPKLNAVCQLDEKGALAAAREADAAIARGAQLGKLHGVPITIKDSFDTKGIISTAGTEGRRNFIPEKDATVVARLRAAGAIILGKTNTPELTLSYDTNNLIYGRTLNPYDLARTPGGSSGGSAAIIAVGGSPLDIGSDTAGSIRIPSHFCGIAGLKPTINTVSRAGHILGPGSLFSRRTHVGPMARYVEDLILTLPIIAGADPEDREVIAAPFEDPTKVDITKLRVAHFNENGKTKSNSDMAQAVRATVAALTTAGLKCIPARLPGFEKAAELQLALNRAEADEYAKILQQYGTKNPSPQLTSILQSRTTEPLKTADLLADWESIRATALQFMRDYEIIICPPASTAAPLPQHATFTDYTYSSYINLLGWPAAVVRVGRTANGLPKGIQIIARAHKEHELLAIALHVEKTLGGWKKDFPEQTLTQKNP